MLLPLRRGKNDEVPSSLTFGIDFDKTITADPSLFIRLINLILDNHHKVFIVTKRPSFGITIEEQNLEVQQVRDFTNNFSREVLIYFCGTRMKEEVLLEAGVRVDIAIDDRPEDFSLLPPSSYNNNYCWRCIDYEHSSDSCPIWKYKG